MAVDESGLSFEHDMDMDQEALMSCPCSEAMPYCSSGRIDYSWDPVPADRNGPGSNLGAHSLDLPSWMIDSPSNKPHKGKCYRITPEVKSRKGMRGMPAPTRCTCDAHHSSVEQLVQEERAAAQRREEQQQRVEQRLRELEEQQRLEAKRERVRAEVERRLAERRQEEEREAAALAASKLPAPTVRVDEQAERDAMVAASTKTGAEVDSPACKQDAFYEWTGESCAEVEMGGPTKLFATAPLECCPVAECAGLQGPFKYDEDEARCRMDDGVVATACCKCAADTPYQWSGDPADSKTRCRTDINENGTADRYRNDGCCAPPELLEVHAATSAGETPSKHKPSGAWAHGPPTVQQESSSGESVSVPVDRPEHTVGASHAAASSQPQHKASGAWANGPPQHKPAVKPTTDKDGWTTVVGGRSGKIASKPKVDPLSNNRFYEISPCDNGSVAPVDANRKEWCEKYGQKEADVSTTVAVAEPEAKCRIAECGCPADGFSNGEDWCTEEKSIMKDESADRYCHASMSNCEEKCKGVWCGEGRWTPVKNGAKPRPAPKPFELKDDNSFAPLRT